ncbi:dephospho-CoA kinase [Candidatus Pelagibacter sp.]|nr:dephospho-CoA kinase [Candidatus Pelagibacter sp.]
MIRVGVMGGIGSGKSFIAKLFNCPVFNADKEVNRVYKNDKNCFVKLKKKLPKFINSFPVKKKQLVKAIREDKKNLAKIASIVHPIVRKRMKVFLAKNKKNKMVVLDIPLLIENKLNKKDDVLLFVKSKKKEVLKRLKKRTNFDAKVLKSLNENQIILLKKRKLANFIIDNNFTKIIMKKKVNFLKKKILYERNST